MKYNIAVGITVLIGLAVSVVYGMLAGVAINFMLFLIVEKLIKDK